MGVTHFPTSFRRSLQRLWCKLPSNATPQRLNRVSPHHPPPFLPLSSSASGLRSMTHRPAGSLCPTVPFILCQEKDTDPAHNTSIMSSSPFVLTVVGAGNGGHVLCALAGSLPNTRVRLLTRRPEIFASGYVEVERPGVSIFSSARSYSWMLQASWAVPRSAATLRW